MLYDSERGGVLLVVGMNSTQPDYGERHIRSTEELYAGDQVEVVNVESQRVYTIGVVAVGLRLEMSPAHGYIRCIVEDPGWMLVERCSANGNRVLDNLSLKDKGVLPIHTSVELDPERAELMGLPEGSTSIERIEWNWRNYLQHPCSS